MFLGPTDATGALISSDDLDSKESIVHKIDEYLTNKDSYSFWSNFKKGERLVKIGKTGQNLMDIQLLVFEENGE
jgi:glycerate-2-kinase